MAVGDAGEDRDHFLVAFERVDIDDVAAVRQRRECRRCGRNPRCRDRRTRSGSFCSAIRSGLTRKNQSSSRVMSASDDRDVIAIAGQGLQLAFLALEAAAERVADPRRGRGARLHHQQRAVIGRGLMRQQRERIWQIAPAQRLLVQREHVGFGIAATIAAIRRVEIGLRCACGEIAVPQRHVEGRMLAAHETGAARAVGLPERERQQQQRPALGIVARSR